MKLEKLVHDRQPDSLKEGMLCLRSNLDDDKSKAWIIRTFQGIKKTLCVQSVQGDQTDWQLGIMNGIVVGISYLDFSPLGPEKSFNMLTIASLLILSQSNHTVKILYIIYLINNCFMHQVCLKKQSSIFGSVRP